MKKELINFIRNLSEADKKNLTQKALKTTEEVGELAKAILPFENAAGTLHRFSDRRKILENVVDVYLTSISIAYDLKFSDDEIEEMVVEKAKKWQGIQAKESAIKFPLPYEIHVTVDLSGVVDGIGDHLEGQNLAIESFKKSCEWIKVKPIIIHLEKDSAVLMQDVMTSSTHFGDNRTAYDEAKRIEDELKRWGWKVVRVKIETVPWHPAAPSKTLIDEKMPEDCYFESHLRIIAKPKDKGVLKRVADNHSAHLSQNFFKKLNDEQYILMMTLRSSEDGYEQFKRKVDSLKNDLTKLQFTVDKIEIEFAVYDTKVLHDAVWIG